MTSAKEWDAPVNAQVFLVDPRSRTVSWMNEPAAQALPHAGGRGEDAVTIDQVLPMAELLGVPAALAAVADTGVAQHLHADIVSTSKGSVAFVVSIYRLPDGMVLVVAENAWQPARDKPDARTSRPRRRTP